MTYFQMVQEKCRWYRIWTLIGTDTCSYRCKQMVRLVQIHNGADGMIAQLHILHADADGAGGINIQIVDFISLQFAFQGDWMSAVLFC